MGDVVVGDIELVGDVPVCDIVYNISQSMVHMGKDCMQTVLKDRTYHAERYVETLFGWFYWKICSVLWSIFFFLYFNIRHDIDSLYS